MRACMTALVGSRAGSPAQRVIRFRIDVVIDAEMRRGPREQRGRHEVQLDHRDIVRTTSPKGLPSGASERHDWPMEDHAVPSSTGREALAAGDWPGARSFFESILMGTNDPEAHLGLGRALWWMQDIDGALFHMEAAYAAFRSRGDRREAAAAALWLSREYAAAHGNEPASAGWEARAEGLLRDEGPCIEQGWLALTRAERATTPERIATAAREALDIARAHGDADLESESLARVGYAEVAAGDVVPGTTKLDEAMAAVTGGEVERLETIGDVTCTAIAAFELAADWQRIERWGQVIEQWVRQHNSAPVIGFCNACCAELFLSSGQWEMAEGLLTEGLDVLRSSDQRARCVHPAAKLAELRVLQGRIEEAEQLVAGYEELPEAAHALASLHLARGESSVATAVIRRRLNRTGGDSVLAAPFLALLVDVQLTDGDMAGAAPRPNASGRSESGRRSLASWPRPPSPPARWPRPEAKMTHPTVWPRRWPPSATRA